VTKALTLVSFDLCPYVQRAAIVLAEKAVPFTRRTVDLSDKPDWFKAISPLGKVPLLMIDDTVLFESAAIVEYLDETQGRPLHPSDPIARARHRAWIEFGSSILADIWTVETTADAHAFNGKVQVLRTKFARLESELGAGPYFAGSAFSIVDAVFAPVFRYFDVFDQFTNLGVHDDLPRLQNWRTSLRMRPSVMGAVVPDYAERLRAFVSRHGGVLSERMG
jgi:glutathione S-transferase